MRAYGLKLKKNHRWHAPLGNSAASNEIRTESAWLLETAASKSFNSGTFEVFILYTFGRCSKYDTVEKALVKQVFSSPVFIPCAAEIMKHHFYTSIDECHLTQVYTDTEKVENTDTPLPRFSSSSDTTESPNICNVKALNTEEVSKESGLCKDPGPGKHEIPRIKDGGDVEIGSHIEGKRPSFSFAESSRLSKHSTCCRDEWVQKSSLELIWAINEDPEKLCILRPSGSIMIRIWRECCWKHLQAGNML